MPDLLVSDDGQAVNFTLATDKGEQLIGSGPLKRYCHGPGRGAVGILVRMAPTQVAQLDAWISRQSPLHPSRPEAIRRLLEAPLMTQQK